MKDKIISTLYAWEEQVELKNRYISGEEDISLPMFATLFKETFEIIQKAKSIIYKRILPKSVFATMDYLRLIATISKYSNFECIEDQSKDKSLTATCLVAQKLIDHATYYVEFDVNNDGNLDFHSYEENDVLEFCRIDYPLKSDEESYETYEYKIYDGNFEELLWLAAEI